jgi:hypothetical protein
LGLQSRKASQVGVLSEVLRHEIGYCRLERSKRGSISRGTQFSNHGFGEILIACSDGGRGLDLFDYRSDPQAGPTASIS